MKRALALAVALLVAGCFPSATREPQRFHILDVPEAQSGPARVPRPTTLAVPPTTTSSFYDNPDLVYSRAPGTRAYYQFNSWTERPSRAIHDALLARLEGSGSFQGVSSGDGGARTGLLLRTHLEEIYHDAEKPPGVARIALSAELSEAGGRVLARRRFGASAPAPTYDAAGAVQGFRQALAAVLDELVTWVDEQAPR